MLLLPQLSRPALLLVALIYLYLTKTALASILCYSCTSNQPGCSENNVSWRIHGSLVCPKVDDQCVKVIEKTSSHTLVTRDCLSNLIAIRSDVPGDKFEGCRSTKPNPKIGNYVTNNLKELNIAGGSDNVTYCFCKLDHLCNNAVTLSKKQLIYSVASLSSGIAAIMSHLLLTHV